MEFRLVSEDGATFVEGPAGSGALDSVGAFTALIEACWGADCHAALIHAASLSPLFFDLSSRLAGEVLQRLRNYGVRVAVVVPPGWDEGSTRFGEMVAEERLGRDFALFDSRDAAVRWLGA